jgi:hypothetical protein
MPSALHTDAPYFDAPVNVTQLPAFFPQQPRMPKTVEISPVSPHARAIGVNGVWRLCACVFVRVPSFVHACVRAFVLVCVCACARARTRSVHLPVCLVRE